MVPPSAGGGGVTTHPALVVSFTHLPGWVVSVQVMHVPSQSESQQTPSTLLQTPDAHSSVMPQLLPGAFLARHLPELSQ